MRALGGSAEATIPSVFGAEVRRQQGRPAIADQRWQASYVELHESAGEVAHLLQNRGARVGGRVAVLVGDDATAVAGVLGVLQAGGVATVLDPGDPRDRTAQILADVRPALVLADANHAPELVGAGVAPSAIVEVETRQPGRRPAPIGIDPATPALIVHTSGSTGRPRGVIHTHVSVLDKVARLCAELRLDATDRIPLLSPLSGSSGTTLVFTALLSGATLITAPRAPTDLVGVAAHLQLERATCTITSASFFRHLVRAPGAQHLSGLRLVVLGGEQAVDADVWAARAHAGPKVEVVNLLASTEGGSAATHRVVAGDDPRPGPLPAGRPVRGASVAVVTVDGQVAPVGTVGEIVISSPRLSPGYWNDPVLTAERFSTTGGIRSFRTGDLGRFDQHGELWVVGRADQQVKVRGTRLSLLEVEAAVGAVARISSAAVTATPNRRGDLALTAHVTTADGEPISMGTLRHELQRSLPSRELPSAVIVHDVLPLTSQGKVDRQELSARAEALEAAGAHLKAAELIGPTEQTLSSIWAKALELPSVGRETDFFDSGGDSLAAAVIAAEVHAQLSVELELGTFAAHPRLSDMADHIDHLRGAFPEPADPILPVPRTGPLPLSSAQQRVWHSSSRPEGRLGHNLTLGLRLQGPLNEVALQRSIADLVERHESLRTTVAPTADGPVQVVHPQVEVPLPVVDLSRQRDPVGAIATELDGEVRRPFDLGNGPLLRFRLMRVADRDHVLVRSVHHLVSDAWSYRLFLDEIGEHYRANCAGDVADLSIPSLQYGDYAHWEQRQLQSGNPRFERQLSWWAKRFEQEPTTPLVNPAARAEPHKDRAGSPGVVFWGLDPQTSTQLNQIAHSLDATAVTARLALFLAANGCTTGQCDLTVGTYVTNRRRPKLQHIIGDFTNLIAIIARFDRNLSFRAWLLQVRTVLNEATAHSDLPWEYLADRLQASGRAMPDLRAVFGVVYEPGPMRWAHLRVTSLPARLQVEPAGFTFLVNPQHETDRCQTYFDPRTHDPDLVDRLIERYQHLAAAAADRPDEPLHQLTR